MARTIEQINLELDANYKAAFGLTATQMSNAGMWKLLRGVIALTVYSVEVIFDSHKIEVAALAESVEFGNFRWWQTKMLGFQMGDPLVEDNGKLYYLNPDVEKQIIKKCAVIENAGVLQIKIAGESAGELVKIVDAGQRLAIDAFVSDIKPAGVFTQVISNDPDLLAFTAHIVFDGKLVQSEIELAVSAAIKLYLKEIDFDSQFKINKFRDAIEAVTGVVDVFINQVRHKAPGAATYSNLPLTSNHQPLSGYYKYQEVDSLITYQGI